MHPATCFHIVGEHNETLLSLGNFYAASGDLETAMQFWEESDTWIASGRFIQAYQQLNKPTELAQALYNRAKSYYTAIQRGGVENSVHPLYAGNGRNLRQMCFSGYFSGT